jgi:hypothetical protein
MRVDVLVIVVSFLYLGGVPCGGLDQGAEQRMIDSFQPDFARLSEQLWQTLSKLCHLSRLCMRLSTFQELIVSNAALIVCGNIVALPRSTSRLAQQ